MSEMAGSVYSSIIEFVDGVWIDVRRQWKRVPNETVFKFGYELRFPVEALDLPGSKGKSRDRYKSYIPC
jgi:hypothetical protein